MKNHPLSFAIVVLVLLTTMLQTREACALNQPDGSPIPSAMSGLPMLFSSRMDPIDATRDAATMPERFVPGCRLTFTLVTRGPALFRSDPSVN